ncbi:hypothetical protein LLEC1_04291 [Akanthomyces lecanii]|uniref:Uncharacterized protein n=1 Tax=Cordyceps confragosa TaxID=2714763 RepID=A0A179ICE9_CORDF|nr:hypothetical protein LLEC1_04291 [Akanthomyces lecanii]
MPAQASHSPIRIVIGVIAVLTVLAYFSPAVPASLAAKLSSKMAKTTADTSRDPIPGLVVTLAQVASAHPPAFRATITNNNPFAVCFLDYDSPVDELAVQLGLEIPAGGSVSSGEVAVRPEHVPHEKLGDRFIVQMKGEWRAVMAMPKSEVTKEFLEHIPARPNTYQGRYESDGIEMAVDSASLELK